MQIDIERQKLLAQAINNVDILRTRNHNVVYFLTAKGIDLGRSMEVTFAGRINLLGGPGPEISYLETNSLREDVVTGFVDMVRNYTEEYVKLITEEANSLREFYDVEGLKKFKFSKIAQSERYRINPVSVDYRRTICDMKYNVFFQGQN
jgi:hypothetical protein